MFNEGPLKGTPYEAQVIKYESPPKKRRYTPDGEIGDYLIELKGRFRTSAEAQKYIDIRECNPDNELIFIFAVQGVEMPGARVRKDGTTLTQEEWAGMRGFKFTFEAEAAEFLKRLK